jgi:hypothetical protein
MALKDTIKHLKELLHQITSDIEKADGGNKAASQRVRTATVKMEKVAKSYRKESIKNEKSTKGAKKPAAKKIAKKTVKKASHAKPTPAKGAHTTKHSSHASHAHHTSHTSHTSHAKNAKAKTLKAKPKAKSHSAKPRALSFKKPSAKLLTRRHH